MTCGAGGSRTLERTRMCNNDNNLHTACGAKSPQAERKTELCTRPACPLWSAWSQYAYGSCSATCGTGLTQKGTRSRTCMNDNSQKTGCGSLSPETQYKTRPCSKPQCPAWGPWSSYNYGPCSQTCGAGATQTGVRSRQCLNDVSGGSGCGSRSPQQEQTSRTCNLKLCPAWGPWSGYTAYTSCSVTCGSNGQWRTRRTRNCENDNKAGTGCGASSPQQEDRSEVCSSSRTCPFWAPWSGFTFTQCSASCGTGYTRTGTRTRICLNDVTSGLGCGAKSPQTDQQNQKCSLPACPFWSDWSGFGAITSCSKTCGPNGVLTVQRTRTCVNDKPSRLACGKLSPDKESRTQGCPQQRNCPVWTPWTAYVYTPCTATCGIGIYRTGSRRRTCQNDIASGFGCGAKSPEEDKTVEECKVPKCPHWSVWTVYKPITQCSVTCDSGGTWTVMRTRYCIDDLKSGKGCGDTSPQSETKPQPCVSQKTCPYWGVWSGYNYGDCSASCGTGITRMGSRTRICYSDNAAGNGCGAKSPQLETKTTSCYVPQCPYWAAWSKYEQASTCSVTCGAGGTWTLKRSRTCVNDIPAGTGCGSQSPDFQTTVDSCSSAKLCPTWAEWTSFEFGPCSASCGTGVTRIGKRTRTCQSDEPSGVGCGAKSPQEDRTVQSCPDKPCPKWTLWTVYVPVGSCSMTCGSDGVMRYQRTRSCTNDVSDGNGCGAKSPQVGFVMRGCPGTPVPCPTWETWSKYTYTPCSATCGTGSRTGTKTRKCLNDNSQGNGCGAQSPQQMQRRESCVGPVCPSWASWTEFRSVGTCSVTCGSGGQWMTTRTRVCQNDNDNHNGCGATSPQAESVSQGCNSHITCPYWTEWSGFIYGPCSASCGTRATRTGTKTRICRNDIDSGNGCGARSPQQQTETKACQVPLCPQWGLWSKFERASACSVTCGQGGNWIVERRRVCNNDNAAGTACGAKSPMIERKTEGCSVATPCPTWAEWTAYVYGPCTATCGTGLTRTGTRSRTCQNDIKSGFGCGGKSPQGEMVVVGCEDKPCPKWGQWTPYVMSPCSVTCGSGGFWTKQRSRQCVNDVDSGDGCGAQSPQVDSKREACTSEITCPYWAVWSGYVYGDCSATCGQGVTRTGTRSRICMSDTKAGDGCGKKSPDTELAVKPCTTRPCPIWGKWLDPRVITRCSVTCGPGGFVRIQRVRTCENDNPDGKGCGSLSPQDETSTRACTNVPPCPVWGAWSKQTVTGCSKTCGAGATRMRSRSRDCQNDITSKLGCGAKSPEEEKIREECAFVPCPFWGIWTQFKATQACSVTCGTGGRWNVQRTRKCVNDRTDGTACGAQSPQLESKQEACSSGKTCPYWSMWSGFTYGDCSASCGQGITRTGTRTRTCINDDSSGLGCGTASPQVDRQPQTCSLPKCPAWSAWSGYAPIVSCSVTCGSNGEWTVRRERKCENDKPSRDACGARSPQWETRKEKCSSGIPCPAWSQWSAFVPKTACSKTCGGVAGFQIVGRSRTCVNDLTSGGGCGIGDVEERKTQSCVVNVGCPGRTLLYLSSSSSLSLLLSSSLLSS